jgi:glycosyltransferase involved in cell wall biosynthesis
LDRIAILNPFFTFADAVSNDVVGMYTALKKSGHEVRVFANEWTTDGVGVLSVDSIQDFISHRDDILIYHYSMGWNLGLKIVQEANCRKVVKYHNITPPEYFAGISFDYENICRAGRLQLIDFAHLACDLYLSDSEYNMWELLLAGADKSKSFVVHPFHNIDRLHEIEPDATVLETYNGRTVNILMVGRVAPNKGHISLIEAFATYHRNYNPDSRLLIVGKEPEHLESYSSSLRKLVSRLHLDSAIVFTGCVSDKQLKAYYLVADVFMITSDHEGFCVPLVEAMALKIPIVACASTAITGTVGKAGLVWKERNSHLLAESINFLVKNESLSMGLGLMGLRRYEQLYTNEKIEEAFFDALSSLV